MRELAVKIKLAPIREVVKGKRIVVVDDSIVRGTTTKGKIKAFRDAGAKEIHMRVSCPPIRFPCFYGIDFPTKEELIANDRTLDQIRDFLEVESLGYMSIEGLFPVRLYRRTITARRAGQANTEYRLTSL